MFAHCGFTGLCDCGPSGTPVPTGLWVGGVCVFSGRWQAPSPTGLCVGGDVVVFRDVDKHRHASSVCIKGKSFLTVVPKN